MIRRQGQACTADRKKQCMDNDGGDPATNPNSWWTPNKCRGCEHNFRPSWWVAHLGWLDAILTASSGLDLDDLPVQTWVDLGIYRKVTAPRL